MKRLRQYTFTLLRAAALTVTAFGGETPTPGVTPPPPPPPAGSDGETPTPGAGELLFEILVDIAGIVLPIF